MGNVLRRSGMAPAPKRREQINWPHFIRAHMAVLAGIDFFTVEVLIWRGLGTYYVLFLLQPGDAPRHNRRNHSASHRGMDAADGSECCRRDRWHSASASAMPYTIATPGSAVPFELCFSLGKFSRCYCRPAVQI